MAGRVLQGNKRDLPAGMEPVEWAGAVFAMMDEGHSAEEAKRLVKEQADGGS